MSSSFIDVTAKQLLAISIRAHVWTKYHIDTKLLRAHVWTKHHIDTKLLRFIWRYYTDSLKVTFLKLFSRSEKCQFIVTCKLNTITMTQQQIEMKLCELLQIKNRTQMKIITRSTIFVKILGHPVYNFLQLEWEMFLKWVLMWELGLSIWRLLKPQIIFKTSFPTSQKTLPLHYKDKPVNHM